MSAAGVERRRRSPRTIARYQPVRALAWKNREGFAKGTVHQIVQTPDGYLWIATEAGLLRFDGVRAIAWQPPRGEDLPSNDIRSVAAGRDGTLWIGTAKGLVSWKNGQFKRHPELDDYDIYTLLEDHRVAVWIGAVRWQRAFSEPGRFCNIKAGNLQCYGSDGSPGFGVTAIYEDHRANLWLGAANGLWRWKPGPPRN